MKDLLTCLVDILLVPMDFFALKQKTKTKNRTCSCSCLAPRARFSTELRLASYRLPFGSVITCVDAQRNNKATTSRIKWHDPQS